MAHRVLTALPVFNEAAHIAEVLDEVRRHAGDMLVVDDGSTDATPEVLSRQTDLRIITHEKNLGYGAALRSAFETALEEDYDVLVTIDCDGQHEPRLIPDLAFAVHPRPRSPVSGRPGASLGETRLRDGRRVGTGPVDIVSGSRYLQQFAGDSTPPEDRREINRRITALLNERLGLSLTDAFCGFKAYRVPVLACFDITELGYAMPLQLWVQAVRAGMTIVEFPVPLVYLEEQRSFGGSLDDSRRRMAYYQEVLDRELAAPARCDDLAGATGALLDCNPCR